MNISRFFGSTNREAMRQVKLALGADALIVSNRRVNGGVEILAVDPTSVAQDGMKNIPSQVSAQPPAKPSGQAATSAAPADVLQAIGSLKSTLEERIDALVWGDRLKQAPQTIALFQRLLGLGFSTALLRAMLKRLPERMAAGPAFQWVRQELVEQVLVPESESAFWHAGMAIAVVGPTGVGKTTTLAKLAARAVARFGAESVVLITTDTYRIGAHEQLKIYGQILRVPVHVVQDAKQLAQIVGSANPESVLLIDNVGISQRDRHVADQAAMLAAAGRPVRRLLVLNAASHGDTLDEVARTYLNDGGTPLAGCIITKVDEAAKLGAVLDVCIRYQFPVHYVSDGQKVPKDLHCLTAQELVDRTLVENSIASTLYAPSSADLVALIATEQGRDTSPEVSVVQQRQRLLSGFFPGGRQGTSDAALMEALQRVLETMDTQVACRQAFDVWQAFQNDNSGEIGGNEASARHAYATIQLELLHSTLADPYLIASHVTCGLGHKPSGSRMRTSLIYSLAQGMMGSPLQSISFANGWHSSNGSAGTTSLSPSKALLDDIAWLQAQQNQHPVLHLLDGGTQTLWRQLLSHDGLSWGAICASDVRLQCEQTLMPVGALAKHCTYRPLPGKTIASFAGNHADNETEPGLWAGRQDVAFPSRAAGLPPLTLHHVRLHQGDAVSAPIASVLAPAHVNGDTLARAIWMRHEQRWLLRAIPAFWDILSRSRPESGTLQRARVAVLMAGCAWQLLHGSNQHDIRLLLRLPVVGIPRIGQVTEGISRLFTVKALLMA